MHEEGMKSFFLDVLYDTSRSFRILTEKGQGPDSNHPFAATICSVELCCDDTLPYLD